MKRLVFTTIYNPLYTGSERLVICQPRLFLDETRPNEILQGSKKDAFIPSVAFACVDESRYIQEKIEYKTDEFILKFLNIEMQYHLEDPSKPIIFTAAQSCLYDTYEEAVNVADQTLKTDYYRGLEEYAYSRIGVPIWIESNAAKNAPVVEKSESFVFQNACREENFLKKHLT